MVKDLFNRRRVFSGFRIAGFDDSLFVAYGPIGPKMNYVEVSLEGFDENKRVCGMYYGLCELNEGWIITGEDRAVVEIAMEKYRLMLPYTRNVDDRNEMKNYYAIVYDNWSVQLGSGEHGVGMPDVCEILFRDNVLP